MLGLLLLIAFIILLFALIGGFTVSHLLFWIIVIAVIVALFALATNRSV